MEPQTIVAPAQPDTNLAGLKLNDDHVTMPPPPLPSPSRGPTTSKSNVTAMSTMKRLSLSFPVQPIEQNSQRRSSLVVSSPGKLSSPSSPRERPLSSNDPDAFLTALAAQERRVLELKEELQKAEVDLVKLKRQWATHETAKKRIEMRQMEQLRSLPSPVRKEAEVMEKESKVSTEEEGRRVLHGKAKQAQRRFEGGKHTRTLSLLSPPSQASRVIQTGSPVLQDKQKTVRIPVRSATIDTAPMRSRASSAVVSFNSRGTKEDLVNTGKQLVGDLKEGLWTFIEDLKQATVGDEAITGARPRHKRNPSLGKPPARNSSRNRPQTTTPDRAALPQTRLPYELKTPDAQLKKSDAFIDAKDDPSSTTSATAISGSTLTRKDNFLLTQPPSDAPFDDEGWENWDSPEAKVPSDTTSINPHDSPRMASPSPDTSSPGTSLSSFDITPRAMRVKPPLSQQDPLPWPNLTKLSPGNLTMTASTLMRDWEASLSDPRHDGEKVSEISSIWVKQSPFS